MLGIPRSTLDHRLSTARKMDLPEEGVELPDFPDDDISAEDILDHMERRSDKEREHQDALNWFRIKVKDDKPIGVLWFGDPHLGPKCNIKLLRRDMALARDTDGLYAANIGDTVDGWGQRLVHLYAQIDISRSTEWKLAKWFLEEAEMPWLLWLFGNHDLMHSGFTDYLSTINAAAIPMLDWRAKFIIEFPNGAEIKIDAAHDHKGRSWFHELQGQIRAALETAYEADLYMAGHHHVWAIMSREAPDHRVISYARCRGYKWHDDFALHHTFPELQHGSSILTIFDPDPNSAVGKVRCFADAEEGAEFLTYLRQK